MATRVYGASDDLIEIDGNDICGEANALAADTEDESVLVILSDGTVLKAWYDEPGVWHIRPLRKGSLFDRVEICCDPEDDPPSDVVHLQDGITWAYAAREWEEVL